jgi:putative FmdB family regulatory protein
MAIEYSYTCKECDFEFEEFHSIEDRNLPTLSLCPSCGERGSVKRNIGTAVKSVWKCSLPTNS